MKRKLMLLAFACGPAFAAAERLPDFGHSAEILLEGKGAIYALDLPMEVYGRIARRDLGDLRVLNGASEVVPHALLRPPSSEKKAAAALPLPYFPLYGPAGRAVDGLAMRVERKADGTLSALIAPGARGAAGRRLMGYVIDASAAEVALRELRFEWEAGAQGSSVNLRVAASDDLKSWRPIASGPLVVLRQGELLLERRAIELPPTRAKYFRATWRSADEELKLAGVTALPVDAAAETPRAWLRVAGIAGAKPGEFVFELPASLMVDRLRFELPNENTVAAVALAVQERPGATERAIRTTVLYRMDHRGEKLLNPDLEIAPTASPRWLLRADMRAGGLGSGLPALHAGWLPHKLVFVARGDPPFRLVFGNADAAPAVLPVHSLVPGYAADKPLPALAARLGAVQRRELPHPAPAEVVRTYFEQMDAKKMWLWGSLVLAVLVIVGMAWKLTRQLPGPGESGKQRPPYARP
ncbi:MAG: DUF3999 domain-containing protein [Betaproteobacteria bacterium]|nr:MAG: DUF3999 domain-containing protein [Betaproteobacteria bacterium]